MPQQRSYKSYANVAPYAPFDGPCFLTSIDGYSAGAGWLQIFDKSAALVNGDIPLKSINLADAGPMPSLLYSGGPVTILNKLQIAFSSTDATYTAANTAFDIWGEVEEFAGYSTVVNQNGLLNVSNAAVTELQIWAEAAGPLKLFRLVITNGGATTLYAQLFASDVIDGNYIPITQWKIIAGATVDLNFGPTGYSPLSVDAASGLSPGTLRQGCSIGMSSTPGYYTLPVAAESTITGYYK